MHVGSGSEGNGVDQDVELAEFFLERGKKSLNLRVAGQIALETRGAG
jgi:hypothetical protein